MVTMVFYALASFHQNEYNTWSEGGSEDQILHCNEFPEALVTLWPLGGHLDGLVTATSPQGHLCQSFDCLLSDP